MAIQQLRIGDRTVLVDIVETAPGEVIEGSTPAAATEPTDDSRGGVVFSPVGRASLEDIGSQIENTLQGLLPPIGKALDAVGPKEWTVEISLGFSGKAGIPFVVSGEANGAIKVAAKWVR